MGKVVNLLSYIGVWLLLSITLMTTHSELDVQDLYFLWVVVGLSVAALLTALFSNSTSRFNLLDGFIVLFFIWQFVNYHFISPVNVSAKWLQTVYLMILYGSLRILLQAAIQMERFVVAALMVCGLWESILGLLQVFGFRASFHHLFAFTGTFMNTGPYGGFLAITMSVALAFMFKHYKKFNRQCNVIKRFPLIVSKNPDFALFLLGVLSFCIAFLTFFAAMSRAAILALVVNAVIIFRTYNFTRKLWTRFFKKRILITCILFAVVLVGAGAAYYHKKGSADARLLIGKISCRIIAKQPLCGTGMGTFFGEYASESALYFAEHPSSPSISIADVPEYSFNEYLQTGVETGMVGLALLFSILSLTLYRLLKAKSILAYGLIVIMIFAFFSFPFSQLPFQILLVVFIAGGHRIDVRATLAVAHRVTKTSLCLLFIAISCGLSGFYQEKINTTKEWKQARILYQMQYYNEARKEYAQLHPILKDNPRFLFEYGHALNKTERFIQSNAILKEGAQLSSDPMFYNIMGNNFKGLEDFDHAENAYKYAFNILPNRIYPLYLLMKLYTDNEQKDQAREAAQRVIDFSPKIDSPAVREIKREAQELLCSFE